MGNHMTRDMDITFFRNIFSMMAYGEPDNFYDRVSAIAREHLPRRVEIGFGPISEGYSPIGTIEIGPFTAGEILSARQNRGLLEGVHGKLWEEEGNGIWKYMLNREPPISIRIDTNCKGIFPFGIELRIERYLNASGNYEEIDPVNNSLDDLRLEREARMIWYVTNPGPEGELTPLPDRRIS
jgi:hypothetical protein